MEEDNNPGPIPNPNAPEPIAPPQPETAPVQPAWSNPPAGNRINKFLVLIAAFVLVVALAAGGFFVYQNYLAQKLVSNAIPTPTATAIPSPASPPDVITDWQAYDSPGSWSLKYPAEWSLVTTSEGCGPVFAPTDNQGYWVTVCGPYVNADETPEFLANQANVSGKGQISGLTVGGHTAVRLDETLANSFSSSVFVEKVAESASASGTLGIYLYVTDKTKLEAAEAAFRQILPTFKFDNEMSVEGKACGGIAANLPSRQCPEGYVCKLDGNYPDAAGKCTKK